MPAKESADKVGDMFTDLQVLMDAWKIAAEIKKPIVVSLESPNRDFTIDLNEKKVTKGKADKFELQVSIK